MPEPTVRQPAWQAATSLPRLRRPDGRPWVVLLADDNAVNREVGVALLAQLGLQVDTAEDGDEVLHKVGHVHYDLVLMDLQMPRLDGLAATRGLRGMPSLWQLPVVALTANSSDDSRRACMAAGMNDFITKPIDIHLLAETLSRWLK
jgi:CheY-like chemotaxis protein